MVALAAVLSAGTAVAGLPDSSGTIDRPLAAEPEPWEFTASLYGWFTGLDGITGVGGLKADIDESFTDIADDIEAVGSLQLEARKGPWGIMVDGFYVDLGASGSSPGPLYERVDVGLKEFMGELTLSYRIYETPCAFVDLYAGGRYNSLELEFSGNLDLAGIQAVSENVGNRLAEGIGTRAEAVSRAKADAFEAAGAARRAAIESRVIAAIEAEAEADGRLKRELARKVAQIRRDGGLDFRDLAEAKVSLALKKQRVELARSVAALEVAKLRARVDTAAQAELASARKQVANAEANLAAGISGQIAARLPVQRSADQDWVDPIAGVRAQWSISGRFFLAGKSDIGGFGAGSELAWTLQATLGYQFTGNVSAELGYRYLHTDYSSGHFRYDLTQAGLFTSLNINF